jgi:hypothetical protein
MRRLEDNVKMNYKRKLCEFMDWTYLPQWRARLNEVVNLEFP